MAGKAWPTEVVLSLYAGVLLCDFGELQKLAEFLMGHPIWTHQFASRELVAAMEKALVQQLPELASTDASAVTTDNWEQFRDREIARLGPTLIVYPVKVTQ